MAADMPGSTNPVALGIKAARRTKRSREFASAYFWAGVVCAAAAALDFVVFLLQVEVYHLSAYNTAWTVFVTLALVMVGLFVSAGACGLASLGIEAAEDTLRQATVMDAIREGKVIPVQQQGS
jgi:hypothetical protein